MDGSGEQQQRQRQRQPKKQQQQPAEEWVAGVAHEDVEGMQLAQLGNDVTQTETRITLLKQQAVRPPLNAICHFGRRGPR